MLVVVLAEQVFSFRGRDDMKRDKFYDTLGRSADPREENHEYVKQLQVGLDLMNEEEMKTKGYRRS